MPRLGLSLLLSVAGWLACQPASSPDTKPSEWVAADSVRLCQRADSLLSVVKTDSLRADVLQREALILFAAARNRTKWTDVWAERFRHYRKREDFAPICAELEKAVQQIWWAEDQHAGRLYAMLGFCLRQMGRNYTAGVFYEKARLLSDRFGSVTQRNPAGSIYKTLANIKTRLGENEEAEKLFIAALDLLQRDTAAANAVTNAFTAAEIYSDLGIAYQNAGEWAKALTAYNKGLAMLQRLRSLKPDEQARANNTLGMLLANKASALTQLNQLPLAVQTVQAALNILQPDKHNYRFNALVIQADIWEKMGRDSQSLAARRQALHLANLPKSGIEAREVSKLLIAMGWVALRQGDSENASLLAQQALQRLYPRLSATDLAANPDPTVFDPDPENAVAEALDLKGEALWRRYAQHRDERALALADSATRLAIEMMENLRDVAVYESSKLLSSQQSRHLFGRLFRILHAYHHAGQPSAIERAFACAERSKAALLRQKVSADALLQSARVDDSLALRERDLRERRAFLKNALFQHLSHTGSTDDSIGLVLQQQLFRIEQAQRQMRQTISEKYRLQLGRAEIPLISIADVQRR
ncbi:MAG: tetratricopeptide repeat protein, partial [Saprospiraceae bacterium]|nr:tetratricopeptide repeat protein [Saprospiraceae bacterium]